LQPHAAVGRAIPDDFAVKDTLPPPGDPAGDPPIDGAKGLSPSETLPMPYGQSLLPKGVRARPQASNDLDEAKTQVDFRQAQTVVESEETRTTSEMPMVLSDTEETTPPLGEEEEAVGTTIPMVCVDTDLLITEDEHTELITGDRPFIDPRLLDAQRVQQRTLLFTAAGLMVAVIVLSLVVVLS
ncbi:MAG: hypothetical protein JRH20_11350, partial [Deltaproteobacteria bacterium]|nr:hypothetical protein [Deltaproteobacteria bacterium]